MGCPRFFEFHKNATIEQYCERFGYSEGNLSEAIKSSEQYRNIKGQRYDCNQDNLLIESLKEMDRLDITDSLYDKIDEGMGYKDEGEMDMQERIVEVYMEETSPEHPELEEDTSSLDKRVYGAEEIAGYRDIIEELYRSLVFEEGIDYISGHVWEPMVGSGSLEKPEIENALDQGRFIPSAVAPVLGKPQTQGFLPRNGLELLPGIVVVRESQGFVLYLVHRLGRGRLLMLGRSAGCGGVRPTWISSGQNPVQLVAL